MPYHLVRQEVQVKVSERLIEVFSNNEKVAAHPRSAVRYRHSRIESHLPAHHAAVKNALKPEGFLAWGKTVGSHTERLVEAVLALRGATARG